MRSKEYVDSAVRKAWPGRGPLLARLNVSSDSKVDVQNAQYRSMQFRIPQTLDGFETAAREGRLVSQEALATVKTRADSNVPWSDSLKSGQLQGNVSWNEESCMHIYCFLYHVDGQYGQKASQLKLLAQFLSSAGLSAAEQTCDEEPSSCRHGTDLSLSIFFTSQMLQRIEVSICTYAAAGLQMP